MRRWLAARANVRRDAIMLRCDHVGAKCIMLVVFGDESHDEACQRVFAVAGLLGEQKKWDKLEPRSRRRVEIKPRESISGIIDAVTCSVSVCLALALLLCSCGVNPTASSTPSPSRESASASLPDTPRTEAHESGSGGRHRHHHRGPRGGPTSQHNGGAEAGRFDFYVMSLSWSPGFCATGAGQDDPLQCGPERHFAFVLHGLWPQYQQGGWPQNCSTEAADESLVNSMLTIMPSPKAS